MSTELRTAGARRAPKKRAAAGLVLLVASIASAAAAATTFVIIHRQHRSEPLAPAPPRRGVPQTPPAITPAPAVEAAPAEPAAAPPSAEPETERAPKPAGLEVSSAAEAFSRANQARRDGQSKDAVRLYRGLQERFPGSSEALVSRVALGRLLLDRLGDSRGALVQFTSYLASPGRGALREEALVGRALALGKLGQRADERSAWQALLQAAPKSAYAERARARLAELGASGGSAAGHAAEPGAPGPR